MCLFFSKLIMRLRSAICLSIFYQNICPWSEMNEGHMGQQGATYGATRGIWKITPCLQIKGVLGLVGGGGEGRGEVCTQPPPPEVQWGPYLGDTLESRKSPAPKQMSEGFAIPNFRSISDKQMRENASQ